MDDNVGDIIDRSSLGEDSGSGARLLLLAVVVVLVIVILVIGYRAWNNSGMVASRDTPEEDWIENLPVKVKMEPDGIFDYEEEPYLRDEFEYMGLDNGVLGAPALKHLSTEESLWNELTLG
jgi:hypothetical protein